MTFISGVGGDGGGVKQHFTSVKPLDIFNDTSGQFPAVFVVTKLDIFCDEEPWGLSIYKCDTTRFF